MKLSNLSLVDETGTWTVLRAGDCKYRELIFKTQITDFFIFCQEKPFGKLLSKISLKLAREFLV